MYDVIIIGCGITGAAIAYELSKYNLRILILEKENDVAMGSTRANSAIIHAGFDPEEGTLMARLNVRGSRLAEEICRELDVPYVRNGAVVLAFDESERQSLEKLLRRGINNGVANLRIIERDELRAMEPEVSGDAIAALYAPDSAICSPWEYCLALAETAVRNGAELKLSSGVKSIQKTADQWCVSTESESFTARFVVNAAGSQADVVHDLALKHEFEILPTRGQYYLLDKSEGSRVRSTVFRCPGANGKGVLVAPTVHGNLIVGPDSELTGTVDVSTTKEGFDYIRSRAVESVPGISFSANIRNFAGSRARTAKGDFIIAENGGFIDAAGICSPGLSAAPAVGEYVTELIENAAGLPRKREHFTNKRKRIRFRELDDEAKAELIAKDPAYGRIVCRCEMITEGEIRDAFDAPIPPTTIDAVKRRVGAGMGRCQGGFCSPLVLEMLAARLGVSRYSILKDSEGSFVLIKNNEH